jgi:hypothetical protein
MEGCIHCIDKLTFYTRLLPSNYVLCPLLYDAALSCDRNPSYSYVDGMWHVYSCMDRCNKTLSCHRLHLAHDFACQSAEHCWSVILQQIFVV